MSLTHASTNELEKTALFVLAEAKRLGASDAEVGIAANKGFSVRIREEDVETVEYSQDKSISVTVYFGKKSGHASLSDLSERALTQAVEAACHIARFTDADTYSGLPDKSELAFDYPTIPLALPWQLSVEQAIAVAIDGERFAKAQDKRIQCADEVSVATMMAREVHANSLGFLGRYDFSRHEMSCVLVAKEKGDMQRDYFYTVASDPDALTPIHTVAKEAASRTVNRLGARRLKTMKTPVIFTAEEARSLFGCFASAISGGAQYRRATFLLDAVNQTVFPSFMHIQEQPHLPLALGSVPFDSDAVQTRPNVFIDAGKLMQYSLGVYSARKLGLKTTGNAGGVHNLTIQTSDKSFADLLKEMNRGLLITELMGQGVNLVTGDYSRGASGFWIENGEIQYPVHEITIAGNLRDMFLGMVSVSNDVDKRGNIFTGSVLINEMTVAGE